MPRREWHLAIPFVLLIAMAVGAAILVNNHEVGDSPPLVAPTPPNPCPDAADGEPRHPTEHTNRADPYTGDGPHPVELVAPVTDVDGVYQHQSVDDRNLPPEWDGHGEPQLFVCEYAVEAGPSKKTCPYIGDISVILVPATYRYRVFEARTSKQVTDFTRVSDGGCPAYLEQWGGQAPASMLESVRTASLENALRPLVA